MILKENQEIGSDCDDDEFVSALLLEDIGEEECCWALVVEQVGLGSFHVTAPQFSCSLLPSVRGSD